MAKKSVEMRNLAPKIVQTGVQKKCLWLNLTKNWALWIQKYFKMEHFRPLINVNKHFGQRYFGEGDPPPRGDPFSKKFRIFGT